MKILYCSAWANIELDFLEGSTLMLCTDLRLPIIEALIDMGHEVSMNPYAKLKLPSPAQSSLLDGEKLEFNYDFLNKIAPFTKLEDYDLLFVEGASSNTAMTSGWPDLAKLLDNYNGNVLFYQHGDLHYLSFPFGEAMNSTESTSAMHLKNILSHKTVMGKKWAIYTHASETQEMAKLANTVKCQYEDAEVPIVFTPIGYSKNFDRQQKPKRTPCKYDLLYIGNQKSDNNREKKLFKFLSNTGLNVAVIGNWTHKGMVEGINFLGRLGGHGEIYDFYNDALATIQIGDKGFQQIGMQTTRITQAIMSGTVLFADSEIKGTEKYILPNNIVDSKERLVDELKKLKAMDQAEVEKLCEQQKSFLKTWHELLPIALNTEFREINVAKMRTDLETKL